MSFKLPSAESVVLSEINIKLQKYKCPVHHESPIAHTIESISCCCDSAAQEAKKIIEHNN